MIVHDVVESRVEDYYKEKYGKAMIINDDGEQEPFQAFAAVGEDILNKEVTGLVNGSRTYQVPLIEKGKWDYNNLVKKASEIKGYARILFELGNNLTGQYDVVIRSINSRDARTATITNLPFEFLDKVSQEILGFAKTKNVYFDVTPKPPATIEYV
ncbi:MAG: GMP synthase (glutamine-hydrolyzing) [Promethearchaeota archaeon]|jgi:GMP synthase PP-ATPase subunit